MLDSETFQYLLGNELKRAVRSQSFLTLVVMEAQIDGDPPQETISELQDVVRREIRETDLVAATSPAALSVVLLDADYDGSMRAMDRVMARVSRYDFRQPLNVSVGAACCPTDAVDLETLTAQAWARARETRRQRDGAR